MMLPAAPMSCFCPGLTVRAQGAPHVGALSWLRPCENQRWARPVPSSCCQTYASLVEGVSSHLFKSPTVTYNQSELLHLWHFLCCSIIMLYSTSVLSASRANNITTNIFFWVKPSSTFSLTTRESHCPIVFRTSPSSQPWECWCHHKWSITTSTQSQQSWDLRSSALRRLSKMITNTYFKM